MVNSALQTNEIILFTCNNQILQNKKHHKNADVIKKCHVTYSTIVYKYIERSYLRLYFWKVLLL